MKLINFLLISTCAMMLGISCKKNTDTKNTLPIITTKPLTDISSTSVVSGGELTNATNIIDKGIVWGTDSNGLTASAINKISNGAGSSNFTDTIKNLLPSTIYYLRAYSVNNEGIGYGATIKFTTLPAQPTVYITGYHGNSAAYWKNGKLFTLPNGTFAHSVYISGNDVYMAGEENGPAGHRAMYWKNGTPVALTNGSNPAVAKSIYVVGNDVYVAGYEQVYSNANYTSARYWKNGVAVPLTAGTPDNSGIAYSICVAGNDVYVAGFTKNVNFSNSIAVYWKNGVAIPLTDSTKNTGNALSIFVNGNDVYVAGQEKPGLVGIPGFTVAKYWKNGIGVSLTDGLLSACANSIYVAGSDVYVAGQEATNASNGREIAKYWKNGTGFSLTDGTEFGIAGSIYVKGTDVYVVGGEGDYLNAKYWKNGVLQPLEINASFFRTTSIFVF